MEDTVVQLVLDDNILVNNSNVTQHSYNNNLNTKQRNYHDRSIYFTDFISKPTGSNRVQSLGNTRLHHVSGLDRLKSKTEMN